MHAYTVQRLYKAILGDYSQVGTSYFGGEITHYVPGVFLLLTLWICLGFDLYDSMTCDLH